MRDDLSSRRASASTAFPSAVDLPVVTNRGHSLTILFSHGNAEDIGMRLQYFREVAVILKCNVFCYEYTGYGQSSGVPTG